MSSSETDASISDGTAVKSTNTDVMTYQGIFDSANEILIGFIDRIPYFVASIAVFLIFSVFYRSSLKKLSENYWVAVTVIRTWSKYSSA